MMNSSRVIYTARAANNCEVFRDILDFYLPVGSAVCDLTWGLGAFWRGINQDNFVLTRIDKYADADVRADFRTAPIADGTQDAVVFDPPYVPQMGFEPRTKQNRNGSNQMVIYGLDERGPKNEGEIDELYRAGTAEAHRILKLGGVLILKTMDTRRWRHVELATMPGFTLVNLFVVMTKGFPPDKPTNKLRVRKNHSYFMIFRKSEQSATRPHVTRSERAEPAPVIGAPR